MEVSSIAKEKDLYINEQIRAKEVMVIGPNGEQLGVKPIKDALTLANYAGFDLVLMNPNATPAVCKIMDYNKFKYENKKRQKENFKKQREANLELKLITNWISEGKNGKKPYVVIAEKYKEAQTIYRQNKRK